MCHVSWIWPPYFHLILNLNVGIMLKLKLDFTTKCPLFTLGDSIKTFSLIELQIAGGDKSQKWKLSFGGFCGDYMGYLKMYF